MPSHTELAGFALTSHASLCFDHDSLFGDEESFFMRVVPEFACGYVRSINSVRQSNEDHRRGHLHSTALHLEVLSLTLSKLQHVQYDQATAPTLPVVAT